MELLLARELCSAPAEILSMKEFTVGRKAGQGSAIRADRGAKRASSGLQPLSSPADGLISARCIACTLSGLFVHSCRIDAHLHVLW